MSKKILLVLSDSDHASLLRAATEHKTTVSEALRKRAGLSDPDRGRPARGMPFEKFLARCERDPRRRTLGEGLRLLFSLHPSRHTEIDPKAYALAQGFLRGNEVSGLVDIPNRSNFHAVKFKGKAPTFEEWVSDMLHKYGRGAVDFSAPEFGREAAKSLVARRKVEDVKAKARAVVAESDDYLYGLGQHRKEIKKLLKKRRR